MPSQEEKRLSAIHSLLEAGIKPTRQAIRRLVRQADAPVVKHIPSLTRKPRRGEAKHVRAGFTKNKGRSKRK